MQFHLSGGNSSEGPIGFCAVIKAETKEEAVGLLREVMPTEYAIEVNATDVVYLNVYFNGDAITVADVDDEEEEDDDAEEED